MPFNIPRKTNSEAARRSAGVLLHVTSLPNAFGIGDLGPAAFRWIDTLADAGQTWWQTLPLNPPDASGSPYSAASSVAGNALLISPEALANEALLTPREVKNVKLPANGERVNFEAVRKAKTQMLDRVAERFTTLRGPIRRSYDNFLASEAGWLDDFALFAALRDRWPSTAWTDWPRDLVRRVPQAIADARAEVRTGIERHRVGQFLFDRQLRALRAHATSRGVFILGDAPIYLSHDSVDCWAHREFFQLDARGRPIAVAGVPPDLFSADGQRWGNPLYNWDALEADGFKWWIARVRAGLRHADVVRIDHFRGLSAYWRVPANAPTARTGKWVDAPGDAMFRAISRALGGLPLVAEDLGYITPDVVKLRDDWKLAGMQIIEFAFGDTIDPADLQLPHNHHRNLIVYPGNHDNDTCVGWFRSMSRAARRGAERYIPGLAQDPAGAMIRTAFSSVADRAIIQAQDVLGLDGSARMNLPGSSGDQNWTWRMGDAQFRGRAWTRLAELTTTYGRAPR